MKTDLNNELFIDMNSDNMNGMEMPMNPDANIDLRTYIRDIPDFPQPGILFRDITPLLQDPLAYRTVNDVFITRYRSRINPHQGAPNTIQVVAAIESRGFLFASVLAYTLGLPFVILRKKGKLPYTTLAHTYPLEYGEDTLEIHTDAFAPGSGVLLMDDLLATGGTALASCHLIEKMGGHIVEVATVIELSDLKGRETLNSYSVFSQIVY